MTTIDTSEASRELDFWLVEHILGWERHDKCNQCLFSPEHIYFNDEHIHDHWDGVECHPRLTRPDGEVYWLCPCQRRKGTIEIQHHSQDFDAAMQLVDKLIADDAEWDLRYDALQKVWIAVLMPFAGALHIGHADTLPLAICEALYKWKEGEK